MTKLEYEGKCSSKASPNGTQPESQVVQEHTKLRKPKQLVISVMNSTCNDKLGPLTQTRYSVAISPRIGV